MSMVTMWSDLQNLMGKSGYTLSAEKTIKLTKA